MPVPLNTQRLLSDKALVVVLLVSCQHFALALRGCSVSSKTAVCFHVLGWIEAAAALHRQPRMWRWALLLLLLWRAATQACGTPPDLSLSHTPAQGHRPWFVMDQVPLCADTCLGLTVPLLLCLPAVPSVPPRRLPPCLLLPRPLPPFPPSFLHRYKIPGDSSEDEPEPEPPGSPEPSMFMVAGEGLAGLLMLMVAGP